MLGIWYTKPGYLVTLVVIHDSRMFIQCYTQKLHYVTWSFILCSVATASPDGEVHKPAVTGLHLLK